MATITREAALRSRPTDGPLLPPITPGEILREEFMVPLGLSARALARDLDIPANRITGIISDARGITAATAILLEVRFKCPAEFWVNLQTNHDLAVLRQHKAASKARGVPIARVMVKARTKQAGVPDRIAKTKNRQAGRAPLDEVATPRATEAPARRRQTA